MGYYGQLSVVVDSEKEIVGIFASKDTVVCIRWVAYTRKVVSYDKK